ncbi:hypothetical protein M427DRAFT_157107 [Gonapodya prolifera JEL478]|uniref:Potassium channel tetramerisation-type BTB domain-containing protein n=1 Tax=Gonapodya prolifera (strain JEL478) TaxID=1344416 RepID=A0A139A7Q6_GONPJ|nr:hypothetical protein M427DRAFT_157107 [Gonapodya prolifera JEL478]|eukprot:KXS12708.1 hypothetical protein M427DRAFT_157107 [Gonapodya prolifera JEL478]
MLRSFVPQVSLPALPSLGDSVAAVGTSVASRTSRRIDSIQGAYEHAAARVAPYIEAMLAFAFAAFDVVLGLCLLTVEMGWATAKLSGTTAWKVYDVVKRGERRWPPSDATLNSLGAHISQYLIDLTVLISVWAKRSPAPELVTAGAERVLDAWGAMEGRYGIQRRTVDVTQMLVKWGVWLASVVATASVKAALAYQRAPGWTDRDMLRRRTSRRKRHASSSASTPSRPPRGSHRNSGVFPTDPDLGPLPAPSSWSSQLARGLSSLVTTPPPNPYHRIRISVGGHPFSTSLATLRRAPAGSVLSEMVSDSGLRMLPVVDDGAYFIDRDGAQFRHVLNWLRGVDTAGAVEDAQALRELKSEAEWYGLPTLSSHADDLLTSLTQARLNSSSGSRGMTGRAGSWVKQYFTSSGSEAKGK